MGFNFFVYKSDCMSKWTSTSKATIDVGEIILSKEFIVDLAKVIDNYTINKVNC
jgi:hypothetical protein